MSDRAKLSCTVCRHRHRSTADEPCATCIKVTGVQTDCDNFEPEPLQDCKYELGPLAREAVKAAEKADDKVNHPNHYTGGSIECIDCIRASMDSKAFSGYCKGNVIKYVWRYQLKGGVEDLKKARVYLDWLIGSEEKRNDNG